MSNLDAIKEMSVFNDRVMNIFKNFIAKEKVSCDDKDQPWMNKKNKALLKKKKGILWNSAKET